MSHTSVMLNEILEVFADVHLKTFFEGTVGAGGHAEALLKSHPEIEKYYACDRDEKALLKAQERLRPWNDKIEWIQGNFVDVDDYLKESVDGFFLI